MSKIAGTVKWFSNKKGFGFINPTSENSPTQDAIFVHQTSIYSDGEYRTLVGDMEFL
jgi:cold shock CspA family protein